MRKKYKPQVPASFYEKHPFDPIRVESATEQLRQIFYSGYTNILEIGVGKGFLKHCFQLFPQMTLKTLDIAEDLYPDYVGSVTNMPFEDNQFDLVVCGEVLEHLPFTDLVPSLKEIRRVAQHKAIISLPDNRRRFALGIYLAKHGWFQYEWNPERPHFACKTFEFDGQHYWEIGYKGTRGREVVKKIKEAGFTIEKQYRLWKHQWHCFFILRV